MRGFMRFVRSSRLLTVGAIAFIITLAAALAAFLCDRLGVGVPWLPLRTGRRVLIGGRQRPGRPVRRLGRSIDEAGQSGRK